MRRLAFLGIFTILSLAGLSAGAVENNRLGAQAFQREDYWSAVDSYRAALSENPRYLNALQGLARSFFALGHYDEASREILRAVKLGPLDNDVEVLYGRILLGQAQNEEALGHFKAVLLRDPKNRAARFGLAEYQVMKGRLLLAQRQFEDLRHDDPTDLRALLSLLYLDSARDDRPDFDRVYSDAIRFHPADASVYFVAASEFYRRRDLVQARTALNQFLQLSARTDLRGWFLQSLLFLDEGKPADSLAVLNGKIIQGPASLHGAKNPQAWYLRAIALTRLNRGDEASQAFRMAIAFDPSNEAYALAYENWLLRQTKPEDPLRKSRAKVHQDRAQELLSKNYQDAALEEFRRSVQLDPYSIESRLGRAAIWERQGLRTSALEELEAVASQNPEYKKVSFLDDLEIQKSLYGDSLSASWGLSLTDLDALNSPDTSRMFRPYNVALFYNADQSVTSSYDSARVYAETVADGWDSLRWLHLTSPGLNQRAQAVSDFNAAFSLARDQGVEYFGVLEFQEGLRDFSGQLSLYVGSTGRLIQKFQVYTKGLAPVTTGLQQLVDLSGQTFPLRGSIVQRKGSQLLVNLGKRDGLTIGSHFTVIRDGSDQPTGNSAWYTWNPTDQLGTWTAAGSDDWMSEGTLDSTGFFDTAALGDEVLFVKNAPATPQPPPLPATAVLQRQLLALR